MSALDDRIAALAATARAWRDPDHPARAGAVARTLQGADLHTEEALAFALNEAMHAATEPALRRWIEDRATERSALVGVWTEDPQPLAGWHDLLAAVLAGHRARVRPSPSSPYLLPAFFAEVGPRLPALDVTFAAEDAFALEGVTAVLGTGSDEAMAALAAACGGAGIGADRRRLRGDTVAAAVLDGREAADERIGLAEDALLHAEARRRVTVVWAPTALSPDPVLDALSGFRELFPAPPGLDGRLQMPRAFLKAADTPHAWGDGFLVSKGPPEPQPAGHIRWSAYADLQEVRDWLAATPVEVVVAAPRVRERLGWEGPAVAPGDAHRPGLPADAPFDLLRAL